MHSKHLGTDAYYVASILVYLVDFKMGEDATANLNTLWAAIKGAYRELRSTSQFGSLTLAMFRAGGSPFPCLKGKASEIRHLVPALERVSTMFLDRANPQEHLMIKGLQHSRAIDACLSEVGRCSRPFFQKRGGRRERGMQLPTTKTLSMYVP